MASGCIIGKCFLCNKPVREDEEHTCFNYIGGDAGSTYMMHEDCFYDFTDKIKKFMEMLECTIESEGGEK